MCVSMISCRFTEPVAAQPLGTTCCQLMRCSTCVVVDAGAVVVIVVK